MALVNPEQILVPVDFSRSSESAILHGLEMAVIFKRGLTLLHVCNRESRKIFPENTLESAKKRLNAITSIIKEQNPDIAVNSMIEEGNIFEVINRTAEDINAVIVVLGIPEKSSGQIRNAGRAVKLMRPSRAPYLMVREKFPVKDGYRNIILPLDATRECKEKILWASYFSRFYDSKIHVLIPHNKDPEVQYQINANKRFTDKLFDDFEVDNICINTEGSVYNMDKTGIDYAFSVSAQLVIIMNTAYYNLFDYITGPPEQKLIVNEKKIPVLCLNPRDDLYVMCV